MDLLNVRRLPHRTQDTAHIVDVNNVRARLGGGILLTVGTTVEAAVYRRWDILGIPKLWRKKTACIYTKLAARQILDWLGALLRFYIGVWHQLASCADPYTKFARRRKCRTARLPRDTFSV